MSAIIGIYSRKGLNVEPKLIKKMNNAISHRGPNGSAVFCNRNVAFGHQMLWTTPESLEEKLPFYDEKLGLIITADARIDNRDELSKKLNIENKKDFSDSYYILKSYEKWGEKCPQYLLGDFAFAIWDKNKDKLFCARDHMGVKPFYYYLSNKTFVFATEIKAILILPNISIKLNEEKLGLFLTISDTFEKENTFYKNIKSLKAACSLTIDKNKHESKRYWKLNPKSKIIMNSDEDYAKAFLEIFTDAVKCRLRSCNPVGVMLSGGIDSSSVTCIARKINNENRYFDKIHSFSYVYDNYPSVDERHFIKKVLEEGGIQSHFIKCDDISPLEQIEDKLTHYDQPLSTYQIATIHKSRKIIHENGIRVILTGEGGDQIVSNGNNYLEELLVNFKWKKLIKYIEDITDVRGGNTYRLLINTSFRLIKYYMIKWTASFHFLSNYKLLNKEFLNKCQSKKVLNKTGNHYSTLNAKKTHYNDIEMPQHQLGFEMLDQDSALYCIDTRHPFYDKRLVEFCYAIPTEMKLQSGFGRYILRIAMDKILPKKIQWRSNKSKIGIVSANNFLSEKEIIEQIINDNEQIIRKYVDLNELKNIFKSSIENKASKSTVYLWRVSLLYFWMLNNENFKDHNDLF